MSSSLLIILLVVVWLFVLAPMVIRARRPIRRTGDALAQTRTLHAGGSERLVPRRSRAGVEPRELELDSGSLFGLPTGEGSIDAELLEPEDWLAQIEVTLRREDAGRRGDAVRKQIEERRARVVAAEKSGENQNEVTTEIPVVGAAPTETAAAVETDDLSDDPTADEPTVAPSAAVVVDGEVVENRVPGDADKVDAPATAAEIDAEEVHAHRDRRSHRERTELSDEDLTFAERRKGRGSYDPLADREAAAARAVRRQRTTLGLGLATLLFAAISLIGPSIVLWLAGLSAVLLVGYLTYLRRQVTLEHNLRERRIERLRRARLGVESREDTELSVVPPRLRRPGAVVLEVDDEDPSFDVLEYTRLDESETVGARRPVARTGGRAAGGERRPTRPTQRPTGTDPSRTGQPHRPTGGEPLRRAVG